MKSVVLIAGVSLLLGACAPAPLTALFKSCPTPAPSQPREPTVITPEGRIMRPANSPANSTTETEP